jgi:hypothetical protein
MIPQLFAIFSLHRANEMLDELNNKILEKEQNRYLHHNTPNTRPVLESSCARYPNARLFIPGFPRQFPRGNLVVPTSTPGSSVEIIQNFKIWVSYIFFFHLGLRF